MAVDIIQFSFIVVLSYIGLLVGSFISSRTKEELGPGKRYFGMFENILIAVVLFVVLFYNDFHLILSIVLALILFIALCFLKVLRKPYIVYSALGLVLYFSAANLDALMINAVIIFLIGITRASIMYKLKSSIWKNLGEVIIYHLWFFIFSIGLFSIF